MQTQAPQLYSDDGGQISLSAQFMRNSSLMQMDIQSENQFKQYLPGLAENPMEQCILILATLMRTLSEPLGLSYLLEKLYLTDKKTNN